MSMPLKDETMAIAAPASISASENGMQSTDESATVSGEKHAGENEAVEKPQVAYNKDYRFWLIMLTLCFSMTLSSLESTIVITSLPTIVEKLDMGKNYVWVANVYFLSSTAVMPLFSQMSNLFGRKALMITVFAAYTLGSGICGGANGGAMLIAGRVVQGIGSGGMQMAGEVIISDMVPLRYRGNYMGAFMLVGTIGYTLGPFLGGLIVDETSWRWIFYLNLPIGGMGIVVSYLFVNLKWDREQSTMDKLRRIDYGGNAILVASTISILIGLTWGGPVYPWTDGRVVGPVVVGIVGLVGFVVYEASGIPAEPVMPLRVFPSWTARVIYLNTFLSNISIFSCFYFIPIFFQSVMLSTPSRSGVQVLPMMLIAIPGAAVAGFLLARIGKYKLLHATGFGFLVAGAGLLALLSPDSSTGAWVMLQAVPALGSGLAIPTLLPAFQASCEEMDQAAATGTWSFIRSFGYVWGVSIAAAIFNSYSQEYAHIIGDATVREILSSGDAYASATKKFVTQFPEPVRSQIVSVFHKALRQVFLFSMIFAGLAFVLVWFEKDVPMRKELETEFGLEDKEKVTDKEASS
ncbi:major facilitator superfamily protein [Sarocladium implicatum]|nr:major facilitator superfamily protein [Sarocladium implicatum]